MHIHAIKTGDVLVKSAFLHSPATSGGVAPYMAGLFLDRSYVRLPVLAWVIEHPEGIIVVDTGENAATTRNFISQARFEIAPDEEIGVQLRRLGIARSDVAKVVLTHLHGDHADGLKDFQGRPIWVGEREYSPFQSPNRGLMSKIGFQVPAWLDPNLITFRPERFAPFEQSFPLTSDGTVIAVPTPGHTAGHLSVIVVDGDVHYFIAGDVAYFERSLVSQTLEGPTLEIALHRQTLERVKAYVQQYPTVYLPSHDPESARRLAAKQIVSQTIPDGKPALVQVAE